MSTLPFLLSVADELDNLNSQTYMDDFGLGFHPHRHYYRNPNHSIQLSLPASTDWIEEKQRCRSHKFVDESQNLCDDDDAEENTRSTSASINHTSNRTSDQDNIDNTVHMYNLSKKCRKYNHGAAAAAAAVASTSQHHSRASKSSPSSAQRPPPSSSSSLSSSPSPLGLTTAISSSDESLQKTSTLSSLASIEFLTCFPVKKNKTPKCASSSSSNNNGNGNGQQKKS